MQTESTRNWKASLVLSSLVFTALVILNAVAGAKPAQAATTKKVAVILFNFQNDTSQPWTTDLARETTFTNPDSVNAYYQEVSYNQLSLTGKLNADGDVFGWYTIPLNNTGSCTYSAWSQAARTVAQNAGVDLSGYDTFIYAFPTSSVCGFSGTGLVGNYPGEVWMNGSFNKETVGHEFGHTLGTNHASSINCLDGSGNPVPISPNCTKVEYGDRFDIMGNTHYVNSTPQPSNHFSAWRKNQVGFLPDSGVQTITANGTYTVKPVEANLGGIQLLRIPHDKDSLGNALSYYYLDFRQPIGNFHSFLSTDPVANGVSIRLGPAPIVLSNTGQRLFANSKLIDTTPTTTESTDGALASGQTFTDPATGTSITTQNVSSTEATVSVTVGNFCNKLAPTLSLSPTSQNGIPGQTLNYNLTLTNNDTGPCEPSVYELSQTLPGGWSQTPGIVPNIPLDPGQTYSTTLAVTSPSNAGQNNYTITERIQSTSDFLFTVTTPVTYSVNGATDTLPPTIPGNFQATVTSPTQVNLTWNPSTDNVGVAGYQITRNGAILQTVPTNSFVDNTVNPATVYTYSIKAFDAAGNFSVSTSNRVVTTTSQTQAHINLSLSALTFAAEQGGPAPATKTAVLTNNGGVSLNWTGTTNQTWCHVTPNSSSLAASANITLNISVDSVTTGGALSCTVTITDPMADNSPKTIAVTYTVTDTTPPSTPTNLVADAPSTTEAVLTWTASTDTGGVAGYFIYQDGSLIDNTIDPTYTDIMVSPGGTYTYRVQAVDNAGNFSLPSNTASVTIPQAGDTTPPTTPTNLSATVVNTSQVSLSWTAATDNVGVTGYSIYRDGDLIGNASTTNYVDTTTSVGNTYSYQVQAFDAAGNFSGVSNVAPVSIAEPTFSHITLTPTTLSFASMIGNPAPAIKTSQLSNPGTANLIWSATVDQAWCHVAPNSGTVAVNANTTLNISVDAINSIGTFSCTITISDPAADNSPATIAVTYAVTDTTPPSTPTNLAANVTSSQVVLTWNASTDAGGVASYSVYKNGSVINTTSNLTYTDTAVTPGISYTYQVKAVDNSNNFSLPSNSVIATIPQPTHSHIALTPNALSFSGITGGPAPTTKTTQLTNSGNASMVWSATANQTWCHVTPSSGTVAIGGNTTLTISLDAPTVAGTLSCNLTFTASNADNNPQTLTVTYVVTADATLPTVSLTAPSNNAQLTGTVTVSATASDNVAVAKVEFYRDGSTLLGTDTTSPYSITWNTAVATIGSHTLTAKAYDASGNVKTSTVINVTVKDQIVPTTTITAPANNALVNRNSTVTITATATDNVGVTKVEFRVNGTLKCTDTTAAYSCAWSVPNPKNVVYQLQTTAFDAAGNTATSAIIQVTSK